MISVDPRVMGGAPCFAGSRVPISIVLASVACGSTLEDLQADYAFLTAAHVEAAQAFAQANPEAVRAQRDWVSHAYAQALRKLGRPGGESFTGASACDALRDSPREGPPKMGMRYWVRPGWVPIVDDAVADLRSIRVELLEAREKLGELRLHVSAVEGRRPDVQKIFRVAADRAARTCDICGGAGTFRSGTWRRVRCDSHIDAED